MADKLGFSGRLAKSFQLSQITPLLALTGLLLGLFAMMVTPKEEEPQINVTFANIFIPWPGASPKKVEELITTPAEQILSELEGVKHIYSVSSPGMATLTVQFKVGEDRTRAIVRLYNAMYSKQDWLPKNLGAGSPIIKPKGIDDVPIVTLTLWTRNKNKGSHELGKVAHALEIQLKRIKGTRDIYTVGARGSIVSVNLDTRALAGYGLSLDDIRNAFKATNISANAGKVDKQNHIFRVQAGLFLSKVSEVKNLVVAVRNGKPVYLGDVAKITRGPEQAGNYHWFVSGPAGKLNGAVRGEKYPAVTLVVAKQPGTNAADIARQVIKRVNFLKGTYIPDDVEVTVTRNYGKTANEKAGKLITKLVFATLSVVLLVLVLLGWREALIVGVAVVITLALTLFASWAWGFTINRVSLFALIFSIGILVDDAIVVVENISRHLQAGASRIAEIIPRAVDEVGGPTILATLTVIAALLPMAFVTGLMGPYMSPIPINASTGMMISLLVAFILTPWMSRLMLSSSTHHGGTSKSDLWLQRVSNTLVGTFLGTDKAGRRKRLWLGGGVLLLILLSMLLVVFQLVILKMLPFDNKSEFQVVVDMPENASLERTAKVVDELGREIVKTPEVTYVQTYSGVSGPISFNGLVRQYYLRRGNQVGDIHVNLVHKSQRKRSSHEIARAVRKRLEPIGRKYNASVKVVEVPPGPPVLAPLVAEIYGPEYAGQIALARKIRDLFRKTPDIVDVDTSVEADVKKYLLQLNRHKAAMLGVSQAAVVRDFSTILQGEDISYLHARGLKYPLPIRLQLTPKDRSLAMEWLGLRTRAVNGKLVPVSSVATIKTTALEKSIYHKDLLPVVYVTGDMAGATDSPLYGMFTLAGEIDSKIRYNKTAVDQQYLVQPDNPYRYGLKWDGEWQVTFETFRDMGIAYSVGLLMIYLLVVSQFKSYLVPLVIMAPIPLTIIGVMPGHALLDAKFTATSMIGMIALAGIIVRNSILLVDFVNQQIEQGMALEKAIVESVAVRAKPIAMTGVAAMLGAMFILDDPIFNGLAISLIFGIFVSTLLTLVVIPVLYYMLLKWQQGPDPQGDETRSLPDS